MLRQLHRTAKLGRALSRRMSAITPPIQAALKSSILRRFIKGTMAGSIGGVSIGMTYRSLNPPPTVAFKEEDLSSDDRSFSVSFASMQTNMIKKHLFSQLSLEQARKLITAVDQHNEELYNVNQKIAEAMQDFYVDTKLSRSASSSNQLKLGALYLEKSHLEADLVNAVKDIYASTEETGSVLFTKPFFSVITTPEAELPFFYSHRIAGQVKEIVQRIDPAKRPIAYVMDYSFFSDQNSFKEQTKAILAQASASAAENKKKGNMVIIRMSAGGIGQELSEFDSIAMHVRSLKRKGLRVEVCIDEAISGNQLIITTEADQTIAAPHAVITSLAEARVVYRDNFRKNDELTAGKFKRPNQIDSVEEFVQHKTDKKNQDLQLVKDLLVQRRPIIDVQAFATGEPILGVDAVDLGAVDKLQIYAARKDELVEKRLYRIIEVKSKVEEEKHKQLAQQQSQ